MTAGPPAKGSEISTNMECFKRTLHKHISENNLSTNLDGFVLITCLLKNVIVVYIQVCQ